VAVRVREDLRELEVVLRRLRLEELVLLGPVHGRGGGEEEVLPRCRALVAVRRGSAASFVDLVEVVGVVEAIHPITVLLLQSLTNILLVHHLKAPRLRIQEDKQRQDQASLQTTEEADIMAVEQLLLTNPVPSRL
jgi:hypothetical protein